MSQKRASNGVRAVLKKFGLISPIWYLTVSRKLLNTHAGRKLCFDNQVLVCVAYKTFVLRSLSDEPHLYKRAKINWKFKISPNFNCFIPNYWKTNVAVKSLKNCCLKRPYFIRMVIPYRRISSRHSKLCYFLM